jgi:hypothetical protein
MHTLNRRTLEEIQRRIIEKGKRNAVSRLIYAKNDKETITAWKSDLSKILLVFNVRSVVVVWLLLTVHSQTELALNTNTIVSGMDHNVTKILGIVSNTSGEHLSVSVTCIPFITERVLTVAQTRARSAIATTDESSS